MAGGVQDLELNVIQMKTRASVKDVSMCWMTGRSCSGVHCEHFKMNVKVLLAMHGRVKRTNSREVIASFWAARLSPFSIKSISRFEIAQLCLSKKKKLNHNPLVCSKYIGIH